MPASDRFFEGTSSFVYEPYIYVGLPFLHQKINRTSELRTTRILYRAASISTPCTRVVDGDTFTSFVEMRTGGETEEG